MTKQEVIEEDPWIQIRLSQYKQMKEALLKAQQIVDELIEIRKES